MGGALSRSVESLSPRWAHALLDVLVDCLLQSLSHSERKEAFHQQEGGVGVDNETTLGRR